MVLIDCPVHGGQVLVPVTRIRALSNTAAGIVVVVRCWCGTTVRLRTGRQRRDSDGPQGVNGRQDPDGLRARTCSPGHGR